MVRYTGHLEVPADRTYTVIHRIGSCSMHHLPVRLRRRASNAATKVPRDLLRTSCGHPYDKLYRPRTPRLAATERSGYFACPLTERYGPSGMALGPRMKTSWFAWRVSGT